MAKYQHGVKFDYPTNNDGFGSHVVRRGAEKTATGGVWLFWLMGVAITIGVATASVVGACIIGGIALVLAICAVREQSGLKAASAAEEYSVVCPGCAKWFTAPAGPHVSCPTCSHVMSVTPYHQ
jgi:hypothetical protein